MSISALAVSDRTTFMLFRSNSVKTCRRLMTFPSHDNQNFSAMTKPFSNSPTTPLSLDLSSDRLLHLLNTISHRILLPHLLVEKPRILNPHPFNIQVMLVLHPIKPSHIDPMMFLAILLYACDEAVKTATCIATRFFTGSDADSEKRSCLPGCKVSIAASTTSRSMPPSPGPNAAQIVNTLTFYLWNLGTALG